MQILSFILLQQQPGMESMLTSLLPFLLIIVVFYFLILRPQQKKQKERQQLLSEIKKGDRVTTVGGILGSIEGIEDEVVSVRISDNVVVRIERSAITNVIKK